MSLSWVEIDLAALRHNFYQICSRLSPSTCVVGVVKSDAYGHGMVPVARELVACGAHFLAVSKFWEAEELRASGIRVPVIVLLGLEPCDMEKAIRQEIRPVVFRMDHARMLSEAACRLNTRAALHIKVDTGMGRLGVRWEELPSFLDELLALPGLRIEGVLSHFAVADESDKSYSDRQISRFQEIVRTVADRGCSDCFAHISNSAGILDLPHAHLQLVRPGISLYGASPSRDIHNPADLRPVMTFKSKILQVKEVCAGEPIGYGRTYVTIKTCRIATIPIGYDDGYPRLLSNRGEVLVQGKRAPVVGRVSMNMITADVTHIPEAAEDDEVVLLGLQKQNQISAEEIADLCGTISYEIFCSIGRHRYKRFLNSGVSSGS